MDLIRKETQDSNTNDNFKNLFKVMQQIYLGSMTTTQIGNLDLDQLQPGVQVYDSTANALKVLVIDGVKTFKTVTVS